MNKRKVRTFSATDRDMDMLEAVALYHSFSKSATIVNLIKKEFWRIFPAGTDAVPPDTGARIEEESFNASNS
ncbi:MAG: hypothetical protein FJZ47_09490 [Candidatus Tectomicrobia bacterium]|uniref:Uncharacterized protein n=1 Tax=Tectimicrobiota bacterium TaxID=2528274 RepID=A0A937W2J7_UNCTE|nr:hypothetical protein [Candidatus Tectomicrobia bacterium]